MVKYYNLHFLVWRLEIQWIPLSTLSFLTSADMAGWLAGWLAGAVLFFPPRTERDCDTTLTEETEDPTTTTTTTSLNICQAEQTTPLQQQSFIWDPNNERDLYSITYIQGICNTFDIYWIFPNQM